jgi:hypothetical protein
MSSKDSLIYTPPKWFASRKLAVCCIALLNSVSSFDYNKAYELPIPVYKIAYDGLLEVFAPVSVLLLSLFKVKSCSY